MVESEWNRVLLIDRARRWTPQAVKLGLILLVVKGMCCCCCCPCFGQRMLMMERLAIGTSMSWTPFLSELQRGVVRMAAFAGCAYIGFTVCCLWACGPTDWLPWLLIIF